MKDLLLSDADVAPFFPNTVAASSVTSRTTTAAGGFRGLSRHSVVRETGRPSVSAEVATVTALVDYAGSIGVPEQQYLLSDRELRAEKCVVSPAWLREKKEHLEVLLDLPPGWDSYGGRSTSLEAVHRAKALLLWFAVADVPPPDVFPTSDGGVQIEWHIHGLNAELIIEPSGEEVLVYYEDLRSGEEWERLLSTGEQEVRSVRSRLLQHGERRA